MTAESSPITAAAGFYGINRFEQNVRITAETLVNQAQNAIDLVHFLDLVPLQNIKNLVFTEMRDADPVRVEAICVRSSPMDSILSNDAVQTILGFVPYQGSLKLLSKKFKSLAVKNERRLSECSQSDLDTLVNGKRDEIKRLKRLRTEETKQVESKYGGLIKIAEGDLLRLIGEQETEDSKSKSGIFCRKCFMRKEADEIRRCWGCDGTECGSCAKQCENALLFI